MNTGISHTVVSGAMAVGVIVWIVRIGSIVSHLVLARLLTVEQYGLAVIVYLLVSLQQFLPTFGYSAALIQQRDQPTLHDVNATWTIDIFANRVLVAILILVGAPLLSEFFQAESVLLVQFCALIPAIGCFENLASPILTRMLEYRRRSILMLVDGAVSALVTLAFAIALVSPWAVLWGAVAGQTARVFSSYVLVDHRPRPVVDWDFIRNGWGVAGWMVGSESAAKARGYMDKVIVARVLGLDGVAAFQWATRLSTQAMRDVLRIGKQTLFPAVARVQNDSQRLIRGVLLGFQAMSLVATMFAGSLAVLSEPLVYVLLGTKWLHVVDPLRLTCIATWLLANTTVHSSVLRGSGNPKGDFFLQTFSLVAIILGVALLAPVYGVFGAVIGICIAEGLTVSLGIVLVRRYLGIAIRQWLFNTLRPLMWLTIPLILGYATVEWLAETPWLALIAGCAQLGVMFIVTFALASRLHRLESLDLIVTSIRGRLRSRHAGL